MRSGSLRVADCTPWQVCLETVLLKCHIGFRGEAHSSSCRQAEGQEGPCCCKRDDDVDLRRLRQTMRLAHWSVCPSQVAPMTRGSVDLDDSVHRVCVCVCVEHARVWVRTANSFGSWTWSHVQLSLTFLSYHWGQHLACVNTTTQYSQILCSSYNCWCYWWQNLCLNIWCIFNNYLVGWVWLTLLEMFDVYLRLNDI